MDKNATTKPPLVLIGRYGSAGTHAKAFSKSYPKYFTVETSPTKREPVKKKIPKEGKVSGME